MAWSSSSIRHWWSLLHQTWLHLRSGCKPPKAEGDETAALLLVLASLQSFLPGPLGWGHPLAVPKSPYAPTDRSLPRVGASLQLSPSLAGQNAEEGLHITGLPSAFTIQLHYVHCSPRCCRESGIGGGNSLSPEEGSYYDGQRLGGVFSPHIS